MEKQSSTIVPSEDANIRDTSPLGMQLHINTDNTKPYYYKSQQRSASGARPVLNDRNGTLDVDNSGKGP